MGSAMKFAERQAAALQSKSIKKKVAPNKHAEPSDSDELSGGDGGAGGKEVDEEEEEGEEEEEESGGSGCSKEEEGSCHSI